MEREQKRRLVGLIILSILISYFSHTFADPIVNFSTTSTIVTEGDPITLMLESSEPITGSVDVALVTENPNEDAPVITFTSPTDGDTLTEPIVQVSGTITDNDSEINEAVLLVNGAAQTIQVQYDQFNNRVRLASGVNTITVVATNDNQLTASMTITVYANFEPAGISVVLTWDGGDLTDVDLHVVDPWGDRVCWHNRSVPSGGQLLIDDTNGYGPEVIVWSLPQAQANPGLYDVQVDYFSDDGQGPIAAFITIILNEGQTNQEMRQFGPHVISVSDAETGNPDAWWDAFEPNNGELDFYYDGTSARFAQTAPAPIIRMSCPNDFNPPFVTGSFTFENSSIATLRIFTYDDNTIEGIEHFGFELQQNANPGIMIGLNNTFNLQIIDNDNDIYGDLDGNGTTDRADVQILTDYILSGSTTTNEITDFNSDGVTDVLDLASLIDMICCGER